MKINEPINPCFLFINPKINPLIKNINNDTISMTILLIWIPLLYCKIEKIKEEINDKTNKAIIEHIEDIVIFFMFSPIVYIFKNS